MKTIEEDLVKVAAAGDYETAYADYLKECAADGTELTLGEFLHALDRGLIRYCERADGIYYINDWSL